MEIAIRMISLLLVPYKQDKPSTPEVEQASPETNLSVFMHVDFMFKRLTPLPRPGIQSHFFFPADLLMSQSQTFPQVFSNHLPLFHRHWPVLGNFIERSPELMKEKDRERERER